MVFEFYLHLHAWLCTGAVLKELIGMKVRVITGIVGLLVIVSAVVFIQTAYLGILISAFSMIAVYEVLKTAQVKNKGIILFGVLFAAAVPSFVEYNLLEKLRLPYSSVITVFGILMLIMMLAQYDSTRFEHVALAFFSSLAIPFSLSTLILLRDVYIKYPGRFEKAHGIYFVVLVLLCSWLTDTFAYFTGVKFGRHKLCPKISPKKTVEGAVGGIILTAALNSIVLIGFNKLAFKSEFLTWWAIIPISIFLSIISMLGDLSASTLKRNYGVKDFGKFFPGHGGVMDRFDSLLFVSPTVYAAVAVSQVYML